MTRKFFPIFISTVLILLSSLAIFGLVLRSTTTFNNNVAITLRENPGTNQAAVAQIESGTHYKVKQTQNGWLFIETEDGTTGWMAQWLLDNQEIKDDQSLAGLTKNDTVIYAENTVSSIALESIPTATYFPINYEADGWSQIEYAGRLGFVQTSQITILPRDAVPAEELEKQQVASQPEKDDKPLDKNKIIMRQANQGFFAEPDLFSEILYVPDIFETFTYISSVENDQGDFYLVSNRNGNRGYIDSRVVSFETDSENYVGPTDTKSMKDAVIVIDAGHGGYDPGAISHDEKTYEKNAALSTSLFLQEYLEKMGAKVIQVRDSDVAVELADRPKVSNENEADVFVSIHYDAGYDPAFSGTTTYYFHQGDYELAESINNFIAQGPLENLGVLYGNFQVLRENHRPSVLLELGYMSNIKDLSYIRTEQYQKTIAEAIAKGIKAHIER